MCSSRFQVLIIGRRKLISTICAQKLAKADFLLPSLSPSSACHLLLPPAASSWLAARQLSACCRQWPRKLTRDLSGSGTVLVPLPSPSSLLSLTMKFSVSQGFWLIFSACTCVDFQRNNSRQVASCDGESFVQEMLTGKRNGE